MQSNNAFPNIDGSYWLLNDREWIEERKKSWDIIKNYYSGPIGKSKKGLNILKRYYLKGEMPDFKSLRDWNDETERHLDLYSFLWLHPSRNKDLLMELRNQYVNSSLVTEYDIAIGRGILIQSGCFFPIYEASDVDSNSTFNSGGINLLMFTTIYGDLSIGCIPEHKECVRKVEKFNNMGYQYIIEFGKWFCVKELNFLSEDCLYQYDEFLECWEKTCDLDERYFQGVFSEKTKPYFVKALHRINRFNVEKEGNTARGRFANKIRKILDEYDFPPVLKQLWVDVKSDNDEIKGLWRS